MTVTDELLAELELCERRDCGLVIDRVDVCTILNELRRMRAENAELERQNGMLTTAVSDVWKLKEGKIKSACLSQAGEDTNWQAEEISRLNIENAELAKDAGRLDYMISDQAIVYEQNGTASPTVYSLSWPVEGYKQTEWYKSARDAIDTAMATQ